LKKLLLLLWVLLLVAPILATQTWVIGEVFTRSTCPGCPTARSALNNMVNDQNTFPYLIPLLWQLDANASPNASQRFSLLAADNYIPQAVWGGSIAYSGNTGQYPTSYRTIEARKSPIDLQVSSQFSGSNLIATASYEILDDITTNNNRIVFILTYDWGTKQPGNYNSSVVAYNDQAFTHTQTGESGEFTHSFTLNSNWDLEGLTVVSIIQTFSGDRIIHQGAMSRILSLPTPVNLHSFNNSKQATIMWEAPESEFEILGYNLFRNGTKINDTLIDKCYFIDSSLNLGTIYRYYVQTVFNVEGEQMGSRGSAEIAITPTANTVQLGSGAVVHDPNAPGPINITNASLRGQFMYTARELEMAGITGETEITRIGFFVHTNPAFALPQFFFRIKHTKANDLSEHDNGPFDIRIATLNYRPPAGNWSLFELSVPFVWNGVDNILIDTAFTPAMTNQSGQVQIIPSQNGYRFIRGSADQADAVTTDFANYKPQIRFVYAVETSDDDYAVQAYVTRLGNNYPNPFNPSTTIYFDLKENTNVRLDIFNIRGQLVKTLFDAPLNPGRHFAEWDGVDNIGNHVGSGLYLYRLETDNHTETRRMILLK
jgi:hypothetical protein